MSTGPDTAASAAPDRGVPENRSPEQRTPKDQAPGRTHAYAQRLEKARALVPAVRERAADGEALRRLQPETERDLHAAGLFRVLQPARIGGDEFDYVALVDFSEALACGDASVAWVFANLASHHWMLAMFSAAAQARLWGADPDVLIASAFIFPCGKATRVEGGYRLSGRWPFSSGVGSSSWNMLAGVVQPASETEAAENRVFLLPQADYTVIDTWEVAGLSGTGSNDVVVEDVFVPEDMTLSVAELKGGPPPPGAALNPNPLYRIPVFALFPYVLSGVALGNAQALLDDFTGRMRLRTAKYSGGRISDFQSTQIRIAAAGARIDAARRIMRGCCIEAMEDALRGHEPDMATKTRYRRDGAYSVALCTEAVDMLFTSFGADALYSRTAAQRRFRDAHAIAAHIAFNFDATGATHGRAELGLRVDNATL